MFSFLNRMKDNKKKVDKPSAVNNDNVSAPKEKKLQLRSSVQNILTNDCNAGGQFVTPNNFDISINDNEKKVVVKTVGNGKACIHMFSEEWIRNRLSRLNAFDYSIEFQN